MKFFKKMSETELDNSNKAVKLGFYTYLLHLFVDQSYNLLFASNLFSSTVIFWTGLFVVFGFEFILNLRTKSKIK